MDSPAYDFYLRQPPSSKYRLQMPILKNPFANGELMLTVAEKLFAIRHNISSLLQQLKRQDSVRLVAVSKKKSTDNILQLLAKKSILFCGKLSTRGHC